MPFRTVSIAHRPVRPERDSVWMWGGPEGPCPRCGQPLPTLPCSSAIQPDTRGAVRNGERAQPLSERTRPPSPDHPRPGRPSPAHGRPTRDRDPARYTSPNAQLHPAIFQIGNGSRPPHPRHPNCPETDLRGGPSPRSPQATWQRPRAPHPLPHQQWYWGSLDLSPR